MFFNSDAIFTSIRVDCQTPSEDYSKAHLTVTIKSDLEAVIRPECYVSLNEGEEPRRVQTEIEKLVFNEDNECYKQLRTLAEAIAETPLGHINNEAMPLANTNYLMCILREKSVEFHFINAPSENGFEDKLKVRDNKFALKALRNFATDMRKLNDRANPALGQ